VIIRVWHPKAKLDDYDRLISFHISKRFVGDKTPGITPFSRMTLSITAFGMKTIARTLEKISSESRNLDN